MTRVLRETMTPTLSSIIYCQYILSREEEWCKEPHSAPDWWSGKERGQPRFMEELMVIDSRPRESSSRTGSGKCRFGKYLFPASSEFCSLQVKVKNENG